MSENALNVLERIKHNRQEQDQCYHALELWAAVKAQGIEIDHVESFGYDPKLSPKDVKIRMHTIQSLNNGNNPFIKKLRANFNLKCHESNLYHPCPSPHPGRPLLHLRKHGRLKKKGGCYPGRDDYHPHSHDRNVFLGRTEWKSVPG